MKLSIGSIQRKNKWCYFVFTANGRQKWISLHTQSMKTAKRRVSELDMPSLQNEKTWLEHLVHRGEQARLELNRLRQTDKSLTWQNLWLHFVQTTLPEVSVSGKVSYRRWLKILEEDASNMSPADISRTEAAAISKRLYQKYISAPRMLRFFKRIWQTAELNPGIWDSTVKPSPRPSRRYRRLSVAEINLAAGHLRKHRRDLYFVFAIGYYTGLRLSDIVELSKDEITDDASFLLLVPNKVRTRRQTPLRIPLIHEARKIILRRRSLHSARLFPRLTAHSVSKRIRRVFRLLNINSTPSGIASFHSLRATFISLMDDANISPHITDTITGHSAGGMHARYSQPSKEALLEGMLRGIPPLTPPKAPTTPSQTPIQSNPRSNAE